MELPEETIQELPNSPASPQSMNNVPLPRRARSQSSGEFPPPIRRASTDASGVPRPVPFAAKFQRVHPGTTGVTVLEHLERLDAVEASLQRLGADETEEIDVGDAATKITSNVPTSPFSPPGSPLPTVHEVSSSRSSIAEEDLVALSKSTSHVEGLYPFGQQGGVSSAGIENAGIEWIQTADPPTKRTVVAEVRHLQLS
jgi:phosphatidylinositol 4-kinase type 2